MENYFEKILIDRAKKNGFDIEEGLKLFNAYLDDPGGMKVKNAIAHLGTLAVSTTKEKTEADLKDLKDLILVNKTIENCRIAMQIDPTTFASVVSLIIIASRKPEITADKDVDPKIVDHIKQKWKDWNGEQILIEMNYKALVDGQSFLLKTFDAEEVKDSSTIEEVDFLPFDEDSYDFMEVKGSDGIVLGYMQKAEVVEVPDNWKDMDFDELAKEMKGEEDSIPFEPDEVINPKFLEIDRHAESLVMKILDYVYIKKTIENELPSAVKRASTTLGIEVGNQFKQWEYGSQADSPAIRLALQQQMMNSTAQNFSNRESKDAIAYPYGVKPEPIGSPQIAPFENILGYIKQEIRQALFTPDSRFESATGSRFTAGEQLSGSMGQVTVVEFILWFDKRYVEQHLFDHELKLQKKDKAVGKIHLTFPELDATSEEILSRVASAVETITKGKVPRSIMVSAFFKRLEAELKKQGINIDDYFKEEEEEEEGNEDPEVDEEGNPIEKPETDDQGNPIEKPIPEIDGEQTPEEKILTNAFKTAMTRSGWMIP
jgi:hypothetical protein